MALDPYSGRLVYEVAPPGYGATPVRVVDPAVAYAAVPCIVVDPSLVGPYGGQPIYVSTDSLALPIYTVSGIILGIPDGALFDINGAYLVDANGAFLLGAV